MGIVRDALLFCVASHLVVSSLTARAQPTGNLGQRNPGAGPSTAAMEELLQAARGSYRTNLKAALAQCDRAIELAPASAQPRLVRAAIQDFHRQYASALKDATEAIELDPSAADAYQWRGVLNFKLRRFRESVEDFDRYLALVPARRAEHWQRGISLYYAGDFEAGRRQFELHESVNPNDVENAVWHFLCVARGQSLERARATLLKPGRDARVPMGEILALFSGTGRAEEVLAAAGKDPRGGDALFYAHLYLGLYYDVLADPVRAREHIGQAVAIGPNHYMGEVARVHARVLEDQAQR